MSNAVCIASPFSVAARMNAPLFRRLYNCCNKKSDPATCGDAMEVPVNEAYEELPVFVVDKTSVPMPTTSGLIRPSSVGPQLENSLI